MYTSEPSGQFYYLQYESFFMITLFGSGQQTTSLDSSLETKGSQKQTLQLKLNIYEIAAYHSIKAPVCQ